MGILTLSLFLHFKSFIMPIKLITSDEHGHPLTPTPKKQVLDMINEYLGSLHKDSTQSLRKRFPGRTFPDGSPFCEAKSGWVSRSELDQLLDDNGGDGLRIYYGCHKESTLKEAGVEYQGMHNIILVATKSIPGQPGYKSSDQLTESKDPEEANSVVVTGITGYQGDAGDLVPLCPPRCPDNPLP